MSTVLGGAMLARREAGPSAAVSLQPLPATLSFLLSHCDRKNKHPFALPTSAMGQKGKAHGVWVLGLRGNTVPSTGALSWGRTCVWEMGLEG